MKSILSMIINIRNLFPYLLLIAIYFFFVNFEARKDKKNNLNLPKENLLPSDKYSYDEKSIRIELQVIPYEQ